MRLPLLLLALVLLAACRSSAPGETPVPTAPPAPVTPAPPTPAAPAPAIVGPALNPAPEPAPQPVVIPAASSLPGVPPNCEKLVRGPSQGVVTLPARRPGAHESQPMPSASGALFVRAPDPEEQRSPECLRAIRRRPSWIAATSSLDAAHPPSAAIDGDATTAWVEGVAGPGVGQGLLLGFAEGTTIDIVALTPRPGQAPSRLDLTFFFTESDVDAPEEACTAGLDDDGARLTLPASAGTQWFNLTSHWLHHPGQGHVRQLALRVAEGTDAETAIAEVAFYGLQPLPETPGCTITFE